MYEKFYGFKEKPFQIVPNPHFLYLTSKHQNALTYLEYGLTEGVGFILLTGEIGTGKTTLIRHILNQVESDLEVAVIFNTNVDANQLLNLILQEFELEPAENNKAKNLEILYQFLIKKFSAGKRTLLIIDEAQNLPFDALEEVRMLSNLQSDQQALLQIMLVGQPDLKAKLKSPKLAQLSQRISVSYHLSPLSREDTRSYIASRLQKAGGGPDVFTQEAVDLIYKASGGIPRSINIICDSGLVYGFADELKTIGADTIKQVLEDKGGMGLEVDTVSEAANVAMGAAAEKDLGIHEQRLKSLEDNVKKLQLQMDWQLEQLEQKSATFQEELINKLNSLLEKERKQSDHLLKENAILLERYKSLMKERKRLLAGRLPFESPEEKSADSKQSGHEMTEEPGKRGFFSWLKI